MCFGFFKGKFIPASQRPDGTWRKARRVKDGYVPQEEVPLYESKGKLFGKKPTLPVGMCSMIAQESKEKRLKQQQIKQQQLLTGKLTNDTNQRIPGLINTNKQHQTITAQQLGGGATNNHNSTTTAKSKTLKPQELPSNSSFTGTSSTSASKSTTKQKPEKQTKSEDVQKVTESVSDINLEEELAKKLKKLKKKIREIDQISLKIKSGELKKPGKDQLEKVSRKAELLKEIESLEESLAHQ